MHLTSRTFNFQVELRCAQTLDSAVRAIRFIEEFFILNSWLGSASAMNIICTITVIAKNRYKTRRLHSGSDTVAAASTPA
jgi:hypothetical protein